MKYNIRYNDAQYQETLEKKFVVIFEKFAQHVHDNIEQADNIAILPYTTYVEKITTDILITGKLKDVREIIVPGAFDGNNNNNLPFYDPFLEIVEKKHPNGHLVDVLQTSQAALYKFEGKKVLEFETSQQLIEFKNDYIAAIKMQHTWDNMCNNDIFYHNRSLMNDSINNKKKNTI